MTIELPIERRRQDGRSMEDFMVMMETYGGLILALWIIGASAIAISLVSGATGNTRPM